MVSTGVQVMKARHTKGPGFEGGRLEIPLLYMKAGTRGDTDAERWLDSTTRSPFLGGGLRLTSALL